MNRVGGFGSAEPQRRQTINTSPMLVFSDMLMRSGSCELTIVSMWYLRARCLRVPCAAGLVVIAVGSTTASAESALRLSRSASTRNALAAPDSRAALGSSSSLIIAFSRFLIRISSARGNWSWRRLSRVNGGFMITSDIGGGSSNSSVSMCAMGAGQGKMRIRRSDDSISSEPT